MREIRITWKGPLSLKLLGETWDFKRFDFLIFVKKEGSHLFLDGGKITPNIIYIRKNEYCIESHSINKSKLDNILKNFEHNKILRTFLDNIFIHFKKSQPFVLTLLKEFEEEEELFTKLMQNFYIGKLEIYLGTLVNDSIRYNKKLILAIENALIRDHYNSFSPEPILNNSEKKSYEFIDQELIIYNHHESILNNIIKTSNLL